MSSGSASGFTSQYASTRVLHSRKKVGLIIWSRNEMRKNGRGLKIQNSPVKKRSNFDRWSSILGLVCRILDTWTGTQKTGGCASLLVGVRTPIHFFFLTPDQTPIPLQEVCADWCAHSTHQSKNLRSPLFLRAIVIFIRQRSNR